MRFVRHIIHHALALLLSALVWFAAPAAMLIGTALHAQTKVHVDGIDGLATPTGTPGDDWDNAFLYLQDALNYIAGENPGFQNPFEVWVANGTYYPDLSYVSAPDGSGNRSASFKLRNYVKIYAGFEGHSHFGGGEENKNERNPFANICILSGEINSPGMSDNTYHVVHADGDEQLNEACVLDGFVIRDGNAHGQTFGGGGMLLEHAFNGTSPRILRCTFENNQAHQGGAVYHTASQSSYPRFVNCIFRENDALTAFSDLPKGGAVYVVGFGSCPDQNQQGHSAVFVNCLFHDNTLDDGTFGGAIYLHADGHLTVINCTIANNTTGIRNLGGDCDGGAIQNSILWGNGDGTGATQVSGDFDVDYSCVQNPLSVFPGTGNTNVDPEFVDPDEDFRLTAQSPCINTADASAIGNYSDVDDINHNGNQSEPTPDLDLKYRAKCQIDMGAYEFGSGACPGDVAGAGGVPNCVVNVDDLLAVINGWGECDPELPCIGDVTAPCGTVNVDDLLVIINGWGPCGGLCLGTVGSGSASMPQSVQDCMNQCNDRCPGDDQCWADCVDGCVAALCAAKIIECDD